MKLTWISTVWNTWFAQTWPHDWNQRLPRRPRTWFATNGNKVRAIVLLWVATRVVDLLVGILYPGIWNDVGIYLDWTSVLSQGHFPADDPMWQYPPGAAWIFLAAHWIGHGHYAGFVVLSLAADAAIGLLLLRDGLQRGRLSGAWLWAWTGLIVGPILLGRFDVFPALCAVVAVLLLSPARGTLRNGRTALAGGAIAVGALLKVWPGLLIIAAKRRSWPVAIAGGLVTFAGGAAIIAATSEGGWSFLKLQSERGLQVESVAAVPYILANMVHVPIAMEFRYGAHEIVAPGAATLGALLSLAGVAVLAVLVVLRLLGRLELAPVRDVALATVLVSVATSRVYSPQYNVWILALAALCLADASSRLTRVVGLLVACSAIGNLMYPWIYGSLISGWFFAVIPQTVRILLLVAATLLALRSIVGRDRSRTT